MKNPKVESIKLLVRGHIGNKESNAILWPSSSECCASQDVIFPEHKENQLQMVFAIIKKKNHKNPQNFEQIFNATYQ